MMTRKTLEIYHKLYSVFGPQGWWPAQTPLEVIVGAILTQNTSWQNVERAIGNLKKSGVLSFEKMQRLSNKRLARLIRPAGYYNVKAKRLKNFLEFLKKNYAGRLKQMTLKSAPALRAELLSINGIGPETADSILLYAFEKPVFVVDAYTRRIFSRHGLVSATIDYDGLQRFFVRSLPTSRKIFNEYHALLVRLGKEYCKKAAMRCQECPLGA